MQIAKSVWKEEINMDEYQISKPGNKSVVAKSLQHCYKDIHIHKKTEE